MIQEAVEHLAHYLPAQGPIGVFIHHNTLHAFEDMPFEDAVKAASKIYGSEPYMSEMRYLHEFETGRILAEDLDDILAEEHDLELLPHGLLTRTKLRRAILLRRKLFRTAPEIRWWLDESGKTSQQDRQHFAACRDAVHHFGALPEPFGPPTGTASYPEVDTWMIRLCSAFLDQGVSHWPMDNRDQGFLACVQKLLAQATIQPFPGTRKEAKIQMAAGLDAVQIVERCLRQMNILKGQQEEFLKYELFALPGWAGMFHRLEHEPFLLNYEPVPCSLMEYLAVRLTFRTLAGENAAERTAAGPTPADLELEFTAALYDALDALPGGWTLPITDSLCEEVLAFDTFERRRLWHLAFERRHEKMVLGPLAARLKSKHYRVTPAHPTAQVFFCLDEREESIRRHLEEIAPDVETLGTAGFYGIAIDYAGIDDASSVALCPVVVKPKHAVREHAAGDQQDALEKRRKFRKLWSRFAAGWSQSSRSLILGWCSTAILGVFSLFPMLLHILAPRSYGRILSKLHDLFVPTPRTELTVTRVENHNHNHTVPDGMELGFLIEEKVDRVAACLRPAGLTSNFAPVVIILGHGSTSLNNPHGSAYDCGACGGRRGAANGRVFAAMANNPEVRAGLRAKGIHIPDTTWFIGGYHDTSTDEIELFDLALLPEACKSAFNRVYTSLELARAANALERCRRFESAAHIKEAPDAIVHVEERAEHLAQPRPECGHATNAVCVVGTRELTRGLFLDRRWFLASYDCAQDADGTSLQALLAAGGPVCGGINLEYYFSYIDSAKYGAGTKLPHNIAGLVGVMDGHSSDLRTGLPVQMVEIHEPVRIIFIIEAPPAKIGEVVSRLPLVERLVKNRWVRVAAVDPATKQIYVLRNNGFERFVHAMAATTVPSSRTWYAGRMDHLPVAQIGAAA
ncbi:hypothetical protein F183_A08820 [Bryobacterales bacterium F-183]|nr:hypothetical protein F183_A08820 [Bryobacterales bacterium F-183]